MILAVMNAILAIVYRNVNTSGLQQGLNPWPRDAGATLLPTELWSQRRTGIVRSRVQTPLKSCNFQASLRNC